MNLQFGLVAILGVIALWAVLRTSRRWVAAGAVAIFIGAMYSSGGGGMFRSLIDQGGQAVGQTACTTVGTLGKSLLGLDVNCNGAGGGPAAPAKPSGPEVGAAIGNG